MWPFTLFGCVWLHNAGQVVYAHTVIESSEIVLFMVAGATRGFPDSYTTRLDQSYHISALFYFDVQALHLQETEISP